MWLPITDLSESDRSLASPEFATLQALWKDQREQLASHGALARFTEELKREWAIETGLIERLYTFDRGVTLALIERGIEAALIPHGSSDKDPAIVAAMIHDQLDVAEGLFLFVKGERDLSVGYVKELHAALTRNQHTTSAIDPLGRMMEIELARGDYKRRKNNPQRPDGKEHEYCPPEQVASEMEKLLRLHREHSEEDVSPEVQAAWLHHRFTQIHPFQDGNGRVARALASLVFIKGGMFPPVIRDNEDRLTYIDALERADEGDLQQLVDLFVQVEKRALVRALSLGSRIADEARDIGQILGRLVQDIADRSGRADNGLAEAATLARQLQASANQRMMELRSALMGGLGTVKFRFYVDSRGSEERGSHWYRGEIIKAAQALGYVVNFETFRAWSRLKLEDIDGGFRDEIILSIHGIGPEYRGALGAAVLLKRRLDSESEFESREGESESLVQPLVDEVFTISSYGGATLASRFDSWLETALMKGLETWRRAVASGGASPLEG